MDIIGYTESGSIEVSIDGQLKYIPDDPANRHRQMIAEWEADGNTIPVYEPLPVTPSAINEERARRIVAGTVIGDVYVTGRDEDTRNLMGLALAAQMRLVTGDDETITVFRDGDNVDHELTPSQVIYLWQQSAAYVSHLYAKSWEIKDMDPLPYGITENSLWT